MPVQPTYPGVYVQEVSSGVRTIVGVSTSVTAFVGVAKRGPINKPVTIYNYAEYEKRFGGLSADSEMSYAVRSFFLNGGSQAIIVRIARNVVQAWTNLNDNAPVAILKVTALQGGTDGNTIDVSVDYNTSNKENSFNLTVRNRTSAAPADNRTETYSNLSMNSLHPRYVEKIVNGASDLVFVTRLTPSFNWQTGFAESRIVATGSQVGYAGQITTGRNKFRISVNGADPVSITLPGGYTDMATLVTGIGTAIGASVSVSAPAATGGNTLRISSALTSNENSSVEILPGLTDDCSVGLGLGPFNGGKQIDGAAIHRPKVTPPAVSITSSSDIVGSVLNPGGAFTGTFTISLNGNLAQSVDFNVSGGLTGSNATQRLADLATRLQAAVRGLRAGIPAYDGFTCTDNGLGTRLTITCGTRGAGSSIVITSTTLSNNLALFGSTAAQTDTYLTGGSEDTFNDSQAYGVFVGSRALRQGLFALESVDIFNILCLPGIPNGNAERAGILSDADAYCKERRAFLVVDASLNDDLPTEISATIVGTTLPKSDNAAVYYPWILVPDPLNGGMPRKSAPCGAIAGLYARTDSSRGIWKAPAGTEALITGATGLTYTLTDPENGSLNPLGVNCLRTFPVYGTVCWGARTLKGNDQFASEYKYVPIRRLAYYMEESLYRGLKWAVFEPNDEPLWAQIRLNVGAFMQNLFRQGAFQGQKRDDAYFVKCDKETTTQNDINLGIVNIWVGFAPLKPAEFVVLYLQQIAGQIQV